MTVGSWALSPSPDAKSRADDRSSAGQSTGGAVLPTGAGSTAGSGTSGSSETADAGESATSHAESPVSFSYLVCTDATRTACFSGAVDVTILPATLVAQSSPHVTITAGQSLTIPAPAFLSRSAGADWSSLTVSAGSGHVRAESDSIVYAAPATAGVDTIDFHLCPTGDPTACAEGSIAVSITAPVLAVAPSPAAAVLSPPATTSRSASSPTPSPAATALTAANAGLSSGSDATWWVVGGSILFMFGGGGTVLAWKKH